MKLADILSYLRPGAEWNLRGDTYDGLEWLDKTQSMPTQTEISNAKTKIEYKFLRAPEYPPLTDFADAYVSLVNGDSAPMNVYISACNAVKAKYPKP